MNHSFALNGLQGQLNNPVMLRGTFGNMFQEAVSQAKWRRFLAQFIGRSTQLQPLKSIDPTKVQKMARLTHVDLDDIVGSEGRSNDFDNQFRPLKIHARDRWVGIALARYKQQVLPPVQLVLTDAGYFVRDGHHRISVARAMGQAMIEAEIV